MRTKTLSLIIAIFLYAGVSALAALDLQFTTAITQTPDPANTGNTVAFKVTFKTVGGAVDNMKITGGIDGSKIFERTYAHINANLQRTDSFTWTAAAGSHTVWFELDPGKTAGDSNYSNNRVEKSFTISVPLTEFKYTPPPDPKIDLNRLLKFKPDLIIENIQLTPSMPDAQVKVNTTVGFKLIVKNIGIGPAKSSNLKIKIYKCKAYTIECNSTYFEVEPQTPEIAPNGIYEFTGSALISQIGYFQIIANADYGNLITELNEDNNSKFRYFKVIP